MSENRSARITLIAAIIGIPVGLAAFFNYSPYQENNFTNIRVSYSNPTETSSLWAAYEAAEAARIELSAKWAARNAGVRRSEYEPVENSQTTVEAVDETEFVAAISFQNSGPKSLRNIRVVHALIDKEGEFSKGALEQGYLALDDLFEHSKISVSGRPENFAICIDYPSGPMRRSWVVYRGVPLNASQGLMGMVETSGRQSSFDAGSYFLGLGGCSASLRSALES